MDSFAQVSKAIAAWFAVTLTDWFSRKWGFIVSGDLVEAIKTIGESALLGLVGFVAVYFAPKNKEVA